MSFDRSMYKKIYTISIPKGAIMRIAKANPGVDLNNFNSKRCDYEASTAAASGAALNFNSKRCDYEAWR